MTIIEVLQTGRPFKLSTNSEPGWIYYDPIKNNGWFFKVVDPNLPLDEHTTEDIGTSLDLYREELLSNDWIVFT